MWPPVPQHRGIGTSECVGIAVAARHEPQASLLTLARHAKAPRKSVRDSMFRYFWFAVRVRSRRILSACLFGGAVLLICGMSRADEPTLARVQQLIGDGDSANAADMARRFVRALPSGSADDCGPITELQILAAGVDPSHIDGQAHSAPPPDGALAKRCGGRVHARMLDASAGRLLDAGKFVDAYEQSKQAIAAWKMEAPDSLELAEALSVASILTIRLSLAGEGIPLARQALELNLHLRGAQSIAVQRARSNLASLYWIGGKELQAEKLYREALVDTERIRGPRHRDVARLQMNLGGLYTWLDDHVQARQLLADARVILEDPQSNASVDDRLRVAEMLGNELLKSGYPVEALRLLEQVLNTREREYSANDGRTRILRRAVASALASVNDVARARKVAGTELALLSAEGRGSSAAAAWMWSLLAGVESYDGRHQQAIGWANRALALRRRLGSKPAIAREMLDLAGYQLAAGEIKEAAETLAQFDRQFHSFPFEESDILTKAAYFKAQLLNAGGDFRGAITLALEAEDREREYLRRQLRGFSENDVFALSSRRIDGLSLAFSISIEHHVNDASALWRRVAARRGMVFDERQRRQRVVLANRDPKQRSAWASWIAASRKLAAAETSGDESLLADARQDIEQSERELALVSSAGLLNSPRLPALSRLSKLPVHSVLISYVRYRKIAESSTTHTGLDSYAALIGTPAGSVTLVDLGSADSLDRTVEEWRALVTRPSSSRSSYERLQRLGKALAARVWHPLQPSIASAQSIYIVTAGSLADISFAAIPTDKGYLVEESATIQLLNQESELWSRSEKPGSGLLAIGAIEYGPLGEEPAASRCRSLADAGFEALPGTSFEIDSLSTVWPAQLGTVKLIKGGGANKDALRTSVVGRRVVHLATHGFFLDDCTEVVPNSRGVGGLTTRTQATGERPSSLDGDMANPEVGTAIAGIALAGANLRDSHTHQSDGILTVEEAASLDLGGVEWVVLSACDSARSSTRSWEGSVGLRRALAIAGAHNTILSLWTVQDEETSSLMVDLYRAHFMDGASTALSLQRVQRQRLNRLRDAGTFDDPYSWASFVMVGRY